MTAATAQHADAAAGDPTGPDKHAPGACGAAPAASGDAAMGEGTSVAAPNGIGGDARMEDATSGPPLSDGSDDDDDGDDLDTVLSEDDYVTNANSFGPLVVIFGSRRNAHRRAKKKHSGTQWECEDCTQVNSILDNPCTACGMMDLDLLELGNVGWIADLRKQAEDERRKNEEKRKKEEEERKNKERAAVLAKRKQNKEIEERLVELRRKMQVLMKKEKGGESASPAPQPSTPLPSTTPQGPKPPGSGTSSFPSASPPIHPTPVPAGPAPPPAAGPPVPAPVPPPPIVGTPSPAPKAVKSEGPELPPHLLAARRARETPAAMDGTPPRDSAVPNILGSPVPKDGDRRDRRRRSDSEGRSRRDDRRDKDRDKDRRSRRLEEPSSGRDRRDRRDGPERPDRDRVDRVDKDRPSRRGDDRRPPTSGGALDIMKSILERTSTGPAETESSPAPASARLSGGKRGLSPDKQDPNKIRKTDLNKLGRSKMRMDMYSPDRAAPPGEEGPSVKPRSVSPQPAPLQKRGRGASKWTGAPAGPLPPAGMRTGDRWGEDYDDADRDRKAAGVAVVTSASGKKIFQTKAEEIGRRAGPAGPAPPPPRPTEGPMKRDDTTAAAARTSALHTLRGTLQSDSGYKAFKDAWDERLTACSGLLADAEEIAPPEAPGAVLQGGKGVVHSLATDGGRRPWVNPYTEGLINVSPSSSGEGDVSHVLAPKYSKSYCFSTSAAADAHKHPYVAFDFCDREVLPYQYTIAHAHDIPHSYLRSWQLRASADNYKWDTLSKHTMDETIKPGSEVATFRLLPQENMKFYRYFMIRLDPKGNSRATNQLIATCFELYGYCRRRRPSPDSKDGK